MLGYSVRRLLVSIPVLVLSSVLVFVLVALSGDPLGPLRERNPPVPPEVLAERARLLNLDKPLAERYVYWITHFLRGDFGRQINGVAVRPELVDRLGVTIRLVVLAMLVAVVAAVVAGVISAVRQYSGTDYALTFTGFLFLSMPAFWLAALLKEFLAVRLNGAFGRTVVYTIGASTPGLTGGFGEKLVNGLQHLILPTIALAAISYASWSRFQRSSMLDVLSSDYITLARAKGLRWRRVMVRHALRTALIPLVTVTAIDLAGILGGAVITETVFGWKGMGQYLIQSVNTRDTNAVLAWLMISAVIVVVFNLVADLLYAVLDPRIRYG